MRRVCTARSGIDCVVATCSVAVGSPGGGGTGLTMPVSIMRRFLRARFVGDCAGDTDARDLQARLYRRDELVVVMPPDHPLADRGRIAFADTLDFDQVGLHSDSAIHARVRSEAQRIGRPLRLRVHAPSFDAVCRMAQAGIGVGVVPKLVFERFGPSMGLVGATLSDGWARRELHLVTRPGPLSPAGGLLAAHLLGNVRR